MSEHRGRRRHGKGLLIALVAALSLSTAAPVAADDSEFIPAADNPCGVDILVNAHHRPTDRAPVGYADYTFTNLETGATYVQHSRGLVTETFDASTESLQIKVIGRIWTPLFPGEPGPAGVVAEPGLWITTSGTLEYTLTFVDGYDVLTAFSLNGSYIDLCAELTK